VKTIKYGNLARMILDECNVKSLVVETGLAGDGRPVTARVTQDDIDVYLGDEPQDKPELAERIIRDFMFHQETNQ
jgi:hypothetical protein